MNGGLKKETTYPTYVEFKKKLFSDYLLLLVAMPLVSLKKIFKLLEFAPSKYIMITKTMMC